MAGNNTKNLGQVSGISLGQAPPKNIALIWYDSTPNQLCHKVYDPSLSSWVVINNSILSSITYAELRNLAVNSGLPLGKFYVLTDRGNVVATSITSTKVQYTDVQGNIVIDDLNTSQQYHVPSTNLRMDGIGGTFNDSTKTLTFDFTESEPDTDSYIFGKKLIDGGVFSLLKFKISKLISTASGNAITWQKGIFFNFSQALIDTSGRPGGVVTYEQFTADQGRQDTEIQNIATNVSNIISQVSSMIAAAVTDAAIMGKKLVAMNPYSNQTNLAVGDTLTVVFNKIQGWFNTLKYATGSTLNNYSIPSSAASPVSGDTVQVAIGKLNRMVLSGGVGDLTITTSKLANYSVTEIKLANGAVSTRAIGDSQVTATKIANSAVITSKISNKSVTTEKLADGAVKSVSIADGSITRNKMVGFYKHATFATCYVTITIGPDNNTVNVSAAGGTNTAIDPNGFFYLDSASLQLHEYSSDDGSHVQMTMNLNDSVTPEGFTQNPIAFFLSPSGISATNSLNGGMPLYEAHLYTTGGVLKSMVLTVRGIKPRFANTQRQISFEVMALIELKGSGN